jgi:hypothetical protein
MVRSIELLADDCRCGADYFLQLQQLAITLLSLNKQAASCTLHALHCIDRLFAAWQRLVAPHYCGKHTAASDVNVTAVHSLDASE